MQFAILSIIAALIAIADQVTKAIIVKQVPLYGYVEAIPQFFSITHYQNTGAAWSMLEGQQWLFLIIFLVLTALVLLEYFKFPMPFHKFERVCIAAIYGGGLGNMIDRIRLGYVVDFINLEFMDFPIFNIADCFITGGCFALFFSLLFFNKEFWKDEKKPKAE